jgi:acyl-coenzyme A thioesterase PaaI-like protein
MTERERERHATDAAIYMKNCTDRQLDGVIELETNRLRRVTEGNVAICARIMRNAAKIEKRIRGLD